MVRRFAARSDSAVVFVSGWPCLAVFYRQPGSQKPIHWLHVFSRGVACVAADFARRVFALSGQDANVLDVRGHAVANRFGLCDFILARLSFHESRLAFIDRDFGRLLAGVCVVSAAACGL